MKAVISFTFFVIALVLQLTLTCAGSAAIFARIKANGTIETFGSSLDHDNMIFMDSYNGSRNLKTTGQNKDETAIPQVIKDHTYNTIERKLDQPFKFEPAPNYTSYQPNSTTSKGQKVGLLCLFAITLALAIYSCVLRYELSTLNAYSLLSVYTNTEKDDEEKVGDAYDRGVEII